MFIAAKKGFFFFDFNKILPPKKNIFFWFVKISFIRLFCSLLISKIKSQRSTKTVWHTKKGVNHTCWCLIKPWFMYMVWQGNSLVKINAANTAITMGKQTIVNEIMCTFYARVIFFFLLNFNTLNCNQTVNPVPYFLFLEQKNYPSPDKFSPALMQWWMPRLSDPGEI